MADECQKLRGENAALHQKNRMSINIRLLKTNKGCIKTGIFYGKRNNHRVFLLLEK